jgi:hypothetical protein
MLKLAIKHSPNEIGTSLIGSYSDFGFCANVLGLAPLTKDSRSGRTWFIRGIEGLKKFYELLDRRFRGCRHYIGEWHSHPSSPTSTSGTDRQSHIEISQDEDTNCPEVILAILGENLNSEPILSVSVRSQKHGLVSLQPILKGLE